MKSIRNIRLTLAYEGAGYHGWQIQQDQPTIQGLVRDAIQRITGEKISLIGSGRTDAGTHARRLVANFRTKSSIDAARLLRALNGMLPSDIRVIRAQQVHADFHAQRDASSKIYRYQIYTGAILPPHLAREFFHFPHPLDIALMQRAAKIFAGRHDFASFAKAASTAGIASTVRTVYRSELARRGHGLIYTVEGNGFLHHMVRNLVGTLIEVGRSRMTLKELRELFALHDRRRAGFTAPAHGLVLMRVCYARASKHQ